MESANADKYSCCKPVFLQQYNILTPNDIYMRTNYM